MWGLDVFKVAELSGNRPLTAIMFSIFQVPPLPVASDTLCLLQFFLPQDLRGHIILTSSLTCLNRVI